jgi:hypothetical protein
MRIEGMISGAINRAVCIAMSVPLFMFGCQQYRLHNAFESGAEVAPGKVVDYASEGKYDNDRLYAPIVVYEVGGEQYRMQPTHFSAFKPYATGATVRVLYNKQNPQDSRLPAKWKLLELHYLILGFACLFVLCGIFGKPAGGRRIA